MVKGSSITSRTTWTGSSRERILLPVTITARPSSSHIPLKSWQGSTARRELHVEHVLVSGDWAVVELHSDATAKNGLRFDNRYCWMCRFVNGTIVEVRAYLDSALVARLFEENPI